MIANPCQQYTAPIYQLFRKEERLQKIINRTQSTKHEIALVTKFHGYDHRIDELLYRQEKCDDKLFFWFIKGS
jgi:diketogulonate reductase-like aldo/keto reductase